MPLKNYHFILLVSAIILLYIFIRCLNITSLPYFGDEAEYAWYSQTALYDPAQRFISLQVGKQPLFIWLTMFYVKIFGDPLLAGRLVSASVGLLTMFALWLLTYRLFKDKNIAFVTTLLFIFLPFAQLINRLGNFDSTVGMFYIWSLYFTVLLVQTLRLDIAYTLGFIVGGGILTKTNAFFSIYLLPVSFLLFNFIKSRRYKKIIKLILLFGVVMAIANLLYLILQLSPYYERIFWFNGAFVYPKREWLILSIDFKINLFIKNALDILQYLTAYITFPNILLILFAVLYGIKQKKIILLLILYFFLPILALAIFGRGISSRWIYPFVLPLLPLMAFGLVSFYKSLVRQTKNYSPRIRLTVRVGFILLIAIYPTWQTIVLALNPVSANIPNIDKQQYITCISWGIRDIMIDLKDQAKNQKIFIATKGKIGGGQQIGQIVQLYAKSSNNITVKGYNFNAGQYPNDFSEYSKIMPAYFIAYKQIDNDIKAVDSIKLIREEKSSFGCNSVMLYKILPPHK